MTPNYWNTSVIGPCLSAAFGASAYVRVSLIRRRRSSFGRLSSPLGALFRYQALCAINGSLICHINYGEVFRFNPLPFQYPSPSPVLQPLSFSSSGAMPLKGSWGKQVLNVEEASVGHGVVMNT